MPALPMLSVPSVREVREIAREFALGDGPRLHPPAVRGEQGQVWRLTTSTGIWAVKDLLQRESEAAVGATAAFQEAAAGAGVPAPAVVRTGDGAVLLWLNGRQLRVFTWAEIRPPDPLVDPARIGTIVAAIHRLGYPDAGPPDPWYTAPVGAPRWQERFGRLSAAGNPHAAALARLEGELCALELLLQVPSRLQRLHRDLWADNVRLTTAGDLCVLDWDNSGPGDAGHELAAVLFEYGAGNPARTRLLYAAYVDAGGPGRVTAPADFSMAVAVLAHILQRQAEIWLRATSAGRRRRAEEAIEEFLSRPLTRPVVWEILAAVS